METDEKAKAFYIPPVRLRTCEMESHGRLSNSYLTNDRNGSVLRRKKRGQTYDGRMGGIYINAQKDHKNDTFNFIDEYDDLRTIHAKAVNNNQQRGEAAPSEGAGESVGAFLKETST